MQARVPCIDNFNCEDNRFLVIWGLITNELVLKHSRLVDSVVNESSSAQWWLNVTRGWGTSKQ